jgi:hypothetical protein
LTHLAIDRWISDVYMSSVAKRRRSAWLALLFFGHIR